jgi:hypothetical protein
MKPGDRSAAGPSPLRDRAPFGFVTNRADNDATIIRPLVFDAIGDFGVGTRPEGAAG